MHLEFVWLGMEEAGSLVNVWLPSHHLTGALARFQCRCMPLSSNFLSYRCVYAREIT